MSPLSHIKFSYILEYISGLFWSIDLSVYSCASITLAKRDLFRYVWIRRYARKRQPEQLKLTVRNLYSLFFSLCSTFFQGNISIKKESANITGVHIYMCGKTILKSQDINKHKYQKSNHLWTRSDNIC